MNASVRRRTEIVRILLGKHQVTMRELAEEFSVTVMTIRNDITELTFDYPIVTIRGHGGGVKIDRSLMRRKPLLTHNQKQAIEVAIPLVNTTHAASLTEILNAYG